MSGLDVADGLPTGGGQVTLVCPLLADSVEKGGSSFVVNARCSADESA
jgi:hypothetical protein